MSKYLYWQDGHKQGKNSANRIGNYSSDWLEKYDELLAIAKKFKVKAIIEGGDLFDSAEPSYRVIDEVADRTEKAGIVVYSLFGNHAERYHSMEHSKYTGMAHLQKRSPNFKYLTQVADKDMILEAVEYKHDIETELANHPQLDFVGKTGEEEKRWKIAVVHAFVCPTPFPFSTHIVCDDIKTNADLVLVAHYHSVWKKKVGNTQYLDIGCFGRTSVTEAHIHPSVVILDTETRSYEIISLKSAKPGDKVFNLEKLEEIKKANANIDEFIKSLESTSFQATSIKDKIIEISKQQNVDKEVVDFIIKKLEMLNG